MVKINISKILIENLYINKKLSTREIARKFGCSKTTIETKLKVCGVKARSHIEAGKARTDFKDKYQIPIEKLNDLYHNENLSMQEIADMYGVYSSTIFYKFKKYNLNPRSVRDGIDLSIPRRSRSIANSAIKYPKRPFSGDLLEKAYLFGFAVGDLYLNKRKFGTTINVGMGTTKEAQINLVKSLFDKYTHVGIYRNKHDKYQVYCNLHLSFDFLLDYNKDEIPDWILDKKDLFLSFLGGYIDAEGHFGISNGIGNFVIGSYDKNTLFEVSNTLKELHIDLECPKLRDKIGHIDKRGVIWKGDLWVIRIRRMRELYKFISLIKPYIKHKKRYDDMLNVENNLLSRTRRINLNEEFLHSHSN